MAGAGSILIVDDDPWIFAAFSRVLRLKGFTVHGASDGAEALDFLRSHAAPGLILLDATMPKMDGWAVLKELEKDPLLSRIPVIFLSADPRARGEVLQRSSILFLEKPVDLPTLLETVEQIYPA